MYKKNTRALIDQVDPGELDTPMEIVYCDPDGEETTDYMAQRSRPIVTKSLRVKVLYGNGKEDLENGRITNTQSLTFIARYVKDVSVSDHFNYDGTKYEIVSIHQAGRKRYMVCEVKKMDV